MRFYLAGQFTRYTHSRPLQILPLASHRPTTFFYFPLSSSLPPFISFSLLPTHSPSLLFLFSRARWAHLAIYIPTPLSSLVLRGPYSSLLLILHSFFLSPFRHVRRAKCTARDAHSPRSSEPRLEPGEILIAPIGVRTYFPRRQRRVEAEGPREMR